MVLVTAHRRENLGEPPENICRALRDTLDAYPDVELVYPVHLNPAVKEVADRLLGDHPRAHLIAPVHVQDMHNLMARAHLVMTDSGGLQEEAPSLGKPVLVMRKETERPEAVGAGTVRMVGIAYEDILAGADELLGNPDAWRKMAKAVNPYGDGKACHRILDALAWSFNLPGERPAPFHAG